VQGDKLYRFPVEGGKCPNCNHPQGQLYILAETESEADSIRANGGGLCGECQCENIIDTHGYITTQKEYLVRG